MAETSVYRIKALYDKTPYDISPHICSAVDNTYLKQFATSILQTTLWIWKSVVMAPLHVLARL